MSENVPPSAWAGDDFCYLTTIGRVSGKPHTIEIWFALDNNTVYMLAGGREQADWVKNIQRNSTVSLRLRDRNFTGTARIVAAPGEDATARRLVVEKYQPRHGEDLRNWRGSALPVAIDLALT